MDIGTTCCICHEEITSFVNLSGKRCVWCQRTVHESSPFQFITHSECVDALGTYCDFGCHAPYIISPSYVQSPFDSTRPRPNPSPSSQAPPPSQPVLHRALSDHDRPSLAQPLPLLDPANCAVAGAPTPPTVTTSPSAPRLHPTSRSTACATSATASCRCPRRRNWRPCRRRRVKTQMTTQITTQKRQWTNRSRFRGSPF